MTTDLRKERPQSCSCAVGVQHEGDERAFFESAGMSNFHFELLSNTKFFVRSWKI